MDQNDRQLFFGQSGWSALECPVHSARWRIWGLTWEGEAFERIGRMSYWWLWTKDWGIGIK